MALPHSAAGSFSPAWQGGGGGGGDPVETLNPGARHVRITVPAGFKPGSTLTVNSPGGECSVQVPSGLQEGDSLQVALPHVEQKIAILNAYFGRDDEPHPKSTGPGTLGAGLEHAARSVIDHAAHALGIRDRIHAPISGCDPKLADKVDRCLEHILLDQRKLQESCAVPSEGTGSDTLHDLPDSFDKVRDLLETGQMLPGPKLHSIGSEEVQLSLCRDRSVATAVAVPIQPLSMQREVETAFVGPPTSSHNGIYISGPGIFCFALSCFTAVDDRTLEWRGCCPCGPMHEIYTTNDGIRYSTDRDSCGTGSGDWIEDMGSCFCFESCGLGYSCKVCSV